MRGIQFSGTDSLENVKYALGAKLGKCKNSPLELFSDRGINMLVNARFDNDLLVFLVSVNSYHGTQCALAW
jgi:hypothetical protein